jgi:hypothetical protein
MFAVIDNFSVSLCSNEHELVAMKALRIALGWPFAAIFAPVLKREWRSFLLLAAIPIAQDATSRRLKWQYFLRLLKNKAPKLPQCSKL